MQGIRHFIEKRRSFARVGAAPAQARAVGPSAASKPPRRVGSWFTSTEPSALVEVTLGSASSRSSAADKRAGCSVEAGTAWVAQSLHHFPWSRRLVSPGGSAGVTGGQRGPVTAWYPSHLLTTEQYMPFQPVSSCPVLLVVHLANHSFKRTGLRPAA